MLAHTKVWNPAQTWINIKCSVQHKTDIVLQLVCMPTRSLCTGLLATGNSSEAPHAGHGPNTLHKPDKDALTASSMQTVHSHCAVFTSLHDVVLDGSEQKICKAKPIVTQALQKSVPHDFELMGQRKGFVRYTSAPLQELVKQHAEALQDKETALAGILQVICCLSGMHSMHVH